MNAKESFPHILDPNPSVINEQGYDDGYNDGYIWLTRGSNFKHPSVIGGYIPGGPYVFNSGKNDKPDVKEYARLSTQYHHDWLRGWIDGINQYVTDNNLEYPKVVL